ncbi:MAG TPA: AmmeMemoRadiSam system protein A [Desulfomonilia bacterium]|nr:AmmeMemoRadiSam system protein A [Deltaproteobacteria bacterium]MDI9543444.1 AmmeMemoRadiSam system protein A [Pseudomonadota bacterium]HRR20204.1 AmmeMemoRadiSam system protein A [Desulfomonilia bacterium]HRR68140.1 AmmeMemoRadiSam system protein A [Desulfomonilia bacterium]
MIKKISEEQGKALVRIARKTIADYLGVPQEEREDEPESLSEDVTGQKRGVFVTLHKHGQLRGCIGFLEARETVVDAVRHNAVNAAFHDPRFHPLRPSEIDDIDIEVSVLTEPKTLEYSDSDDLLSRLRPGVDGVIIRYGLHSATFLPQVWEQLPDGEDFLGQLCLKAGLPADAWKNRRIEVLTYQVQYFGEGA